MNKTAIIGIGIAIIVAGIVGIYAVSNTLDDSPAEAGIGLGEEVDVTIEQEDIKEEPQPTDTSLGLGDSAVATIEEPEEEPPDSVEVIVREEFGLGDK